MNAPRNLTFSATLCLAIALGGCKSSTTSATNPNGQPAQQPAPAGQTAATPSAAPGQTGTPAAAPAGQAAPAAGQAMTAAPPPPPPPLAAVVLPAGTRLRVRLEFLLGLAILA